MLVAECWAVATYDGTCNSKGWAGATGRSQLLVICVSLMTSVSQELQDVTMKMATGVQVSVRFYANLTSGTNFLCAIVRYCAHLFCSHNKTDQQKSSGKDILLPHIRGSVCTK